MFPGKMVDSTRGSTFAASSNPNKTKVFSFPIAAVTNDHKFSGSLQYKSFILQSDGRSLTQVSQSRCQLG